MASAISLGRRNLAALNLIASLSNVHLEDVMDYEKLLDEGLAAQIATETKKRERDIEQRLKGEEPMRPTADRSISVQDIKAVIRRQEEVLLRRSGIQAVFRH